MRVQLYIDSNILLELLAVETALPEYLEKLFLLCEYGAIDLLLPQQTQEEYAANRERIIAQTIKELRNSEAIGAFHDAIENHQMATEARRLRSDLSTTIRQVRTDYEDAARESRLPIDIWIAKLKRVAINIPTTDHILERARHRASGHRAPGKGESLGDRLIWESLLEAGAFVEDLHVVTTDADYSSPLDRNVLRQDLRNEWSEINWGSVFLHKSVSQFFSATHDNDHMSRCAEIGRAIWTLANQTDPAAISFAVASIQSRLPRLCIRQVQLVAQHAITYQDRVFVTEETFDLMLAEFFRLYAKHLDDGKEKAILMELVQAAGATRYPLRTAANGN